MPGAPNRPPEVAAAPAPPPAADPPQVKLLRRLVPSHVALLQESWKGSVPPEVVSAYEKADVAFRSADFSGATQALDQLSIRFAEPRWPTLGEPFRRLRVPIPAPVPPHWDPDHGLPPGEKEARQARRVAEEQLALAEASVAWASGHGVATDDLPDALASAKNALATPGVPPGFYAAVDRIWSELAGRLPPVSRAPRPVATPAPADEA
jgi:hypothetical protein